MFWPEMHGYKSIGGRTVEDGHIIEKVTEILTTGVAEKERLRQPVKAHDLEEEFWS